MGLTSLDLRGPRVRHTNPTGQWTTGGGGSNKVHCFISFAFWRLSFFHVLISLDQEGASRDLIALPSCFAHKPLSVYSADMLDLPPCLPKAVSYVHEEHAAPPTLPAIQSH